MRQDEFLAGREYASYDLAFSLYNLREMLEDDEDASRKDIFGAPEKGYYDWFVRILNRLLSLTDAADQQAFAEAEAELRELRHENKKRMEFFTVLTDRLVAYEYVLNRKELCYSSEEELNRFLKSNPEDSFVNSLIIYLTKDHDKTVFGTRLQSVIGEIPVQMTKNKLFEWIDRAMTLYIGSDETALDELLYMIRMAGLVYETGEYIGEYPLLEEPLREFEKTDSVTMDEETYNSIREKIFSLAGKLQYIIDYYYDLERCVNDTLALCVCWRWLPGDEWVESATRAAIRACITTEEADEEKRMEVFVPLEGRIESAAEKLHRKMAGIAAPDMNAEEEESYLDVALVARLLSNSVFAEIDPLFVETKTVTREMIREKEEQLFDELSKVMRESSRPVKKAIFAKILEKLPPFLTSQEEIEKYVRLNLFGCRDKAEQCAVMAILVEMMENE